VVGNLALMIIDRDVQHALKGGGILRLQKGPKPREQQRSRNRNNEGLTGEESGCFRKEWVDRWE
jgi:hypothetical protein